MKNSRFRVYFDNNRIIIVTAQSQQEAKEKAQEAELKLYKSKAVVIAVTKF